VYEINSASDKTTLSFIFHYDNQEQGEMLATHWEVLPTEEFPGTKPAPPMKERKPKNNKSNRATKLPITTAMPANYTCGKNFNTVAYEIKKRQLNACDKVD